MDFGRTTSQLCPPGIGASTRKWYCWGKAKPRESGESQDASTRSLGETSSVNKRPPTKSISPSEGRGPLLDPSVDEAHMEKMAHCLDIDKRWPLRYLNSGPKSPNGSGQESSVPRATTTCNGNGGCDLSEAGSTMVLQPTTKPITQEQLVNEVKGIYAGLVMVEKKCIEVCTSSSMTSLTTEQLQALIALHRTLLHEHHDFFQVTQCPIMSSGVRWLAIEHAMAARSPMAIESPDLRNREIWAIFVRIWSNGAAKDSATFGLIGHHRAVSSHLNTEQQLIYYSKALVSGVPSVDPGGTAILLLRSSAEKSLATLCRYTAPTLSPNTAFGSWPPEKPTYSLTDYIRQFLSMLDGDIARKSPRWKVQGPEVASSLIAGILEYGSDENSLWKFIRNHMNSIDTTELKRGGTIYPSLHCNNAIQRYSTEHHQVAQDEKENYLFFRSEQVAQYVNREDSPVRKRRWPRLYFSTDNRLFHEEKSVLELPRHNAPKAGQGLRLRALIISLFRYQHSEIAAVRSTTNLDLGLRKVGKIWVRLLPLVFPTSAQALPIKDVTQFSAAGENQFVTFLVEISKWFPPIIGCGACFLYCRDELPYFRNPKAKSDPRRTHGLMSLLWEIVLSQLDEQGTASQVRYPMRAVAMLELFQYGKAVLCGVEENLDLRAPAFVAMATLFFDGFLCYAISSGQGVDNGVFLRFLPLGGWLALTFTPCFGPILQWLGGMMREVGNSAVVATG